MEQTELPMEYPQNPKCECGALVRIGDAFCGKCGRKAHVDSLQNVEFEEWPLLHASASTAGELERLCRDYAALVERLNIPRASPVDLEYGLTLAARIVRCEIGLMGGGPIWSHAQIVKNQIKYMCIPIQSDFEGGTSHDLVVELTNLVDKGRFYESAVRAAIAIVRTDHGLKRYDRLIDLLATKSLRVQSRVIRALTAHGAFR
jgi:hypothetical protein